MWHTSPRKGPHPEDGAQVLGQLPAGLDLLGALVVVHDGDHHLGHIPGRPPDEVQHGLPALLPGAGAGEAKVLLLVRPVEGDGHRVQPPRQLRGDVPVVDEAAVAVGVQPDGGQVGPAGGPELVADPEQIVGPAGGLPIAAKDNLGIGGEVMGQDLFQDSLLRGLLLEPQAPQGGGILVPDAEDAVAVAAVGHVDVQAAVVVVGDDVALHKTSPL